MRWSSHSSWIHTNLIAISLVSISIVYGNVGRTFIKTPQSIITPPGDSVNFECETDPRADKYTWLRNGEPLENGTDTRIIHGSLNIKFGLHFLEHGKQRGDYQCVAWFGSSGLTSVPGKLELAEILPFPSRIGPESKLAVIERNTAVIKCQSPYSKPPASINFYRDGNLVVPDGERVLITDSGNLLIYDVRMNDSGAYICSAQNHITNQVEVANVNTTLKVVATSVPAEAAFKVRPSSRYSVVRGSNVTLECVAVGNPPPRVSWKKYGGRIDLARHEMLRSNLKLVNVQKVDEGSYICMAENGRGGGVDAVAAVELQEPPVITEGPTETTASEGSEAQMTCSARGRPTPNLEWMFNGRKVKDVPGVRVSPAGNKIVISRVRKEHAGIFQCFARSDVGVDMVAAFLYVQPRIISGSRNPEEPGGSRGAGRRKTSLNRRKRPKKGRRPSGPDVSLDAMDAPSRPNVTRLTDESVLLTWEMPHQSGASHLLPIQFFKIQYRALRRRAQWRTLDEEIPPHIRSYAVPNLENGQRYKFRILAAYANNDHCVGETSHKFFLEADSSDDRPIRPPEIIDTEPQGSTALRIDWTYSEKNVSVEGFFIYFRSTTSAGDYQQVNVLGADKRSYVLDHLEPGTTYDVKMQAFNIGGTSGFSGMVTAKTREDNFRNVPSPDGHRDDSRQYSVDDDIFGLPNEFPLYAIVGAVVSALVVLLFVPCVICYCRKKLRPRSDRTRTNSSSQGSSIRLNQEEERLKHALEVRRSGVGITPGPKGVTATRISSANGVRPMSAVGFSATPMTHIPTQSVSASCDRLSSIRRSFTLDATDPVHGRQETSFMMANNSGGSAVPYHTRHDSCSTFHPGPTATSTLGRRPMPSQTDEGFVSFSTGRSMGSLRGSRGFYSADSGEDHRRSSGRRRDWRVVDSSPSEIEASWASQQLLSPPTVTNGVLGSEGEVIEVDEISSPTVTGYDSGGHNASVVMRRGAGDRRGSNPIRPSSWKNDRRRSRDSVRLKREEVS